MRGAVGFFFGVLVTVGAYSYSSFLLLDAAQVDEPPPYKVVTLPPLTIPGGELPSVRFVVPCFVGLPDWTPR